MNGPLSSDGFEEYIKGRDIDHRNSVCLPLYPNTTFISVECWPLGVENWRDHVLNCVYWCSGWGSPRAVPPSPGARAFAYTHASSRASAPFSVLGKLEHSGYLIREGLYRAAVMWAYKVL